MRLLQLVHQYPPEWLGGTEIYTQALAEELANRGHASAVFTRSFCRGDGRLAVGGRHEGQVLVWRAPDGTTSPWRRFVASLWQPDVLKLFKDVVEAFRPDVVHVQHMLGLPLAVLDLLSAYGIPYLVTLHDYWWLCPNAQLIRNDTGQICHEPQHSVCGRCALARLGGSSLASLGALLPLRRLRQPRLARHLAKASVVISPSQFVLATYRQAGLALPQGQVLPHGIRLPVQIPPPARPARTGLRFLYLGGISWQKGVHILLDALKELADLAGWELQIAGDLGFSPAYSAHLLRAAHGLPVHFLGSLRRNEVWQVLADADVVVVPSLWYETFAMVVSEAFALGRPVVASRIGAMAERVRHGIDGILVEPGAVPAWRDALMSLVRGAQLVSNLKAGVTPPLSLAEHVDRLAEIYSRL